MVNSQYVILLLIVLSVWKIISVICAMFILLKEISESNYKLHVMEYALCYGTTGSYNAMLKIEIFAYLRGLWASKG